MIHTICYKKVKCYCIPANSGYLLFDAGWPGTFRDFRDAVKGEGILFKDMRFLMVSHFHIDHAGLAGNFQKNGVQAVIFTNQIEHIAIMERFIAERRYEYIRINGDKMKVIETGESRTWLRGIGIKGRVVQTSGHESHGIALVLDSGEAFIGDLPVIREYDDIVRKDWDILLKMNVQHVYPAHAPDFYI